MANGDFPFHFATLSEEIEAALDQGYDINAKDSNGYTALHKRVQEDHFESVILLLAYEAKVNVSNKDGNTPLHEVKRSIVLKALLVFGVNIQAVNNENKNPWHMIATSTYTDKTKMLDILHDIGSPRCTRRLKDCTEECANGTFKKKRLDDPLQRGRFALDEFLEDVMTKAATSNPDHSSRQGDRVLCLDGGGIKGLVTIQLLLAIQEAAGGRPILELFDWIAGTSTGAFLALALALKKTPKYAQCFYFRMKKKVFPGLRPYDSRHLDEELKKEFGEKTMSDIKGVKIIVTAVLNDRTPADLHMFRNYDSLEHTLKNSKGNGASSTAERSCEGPGTVEDGFQPTCPPNKQKVWKAARASGAAPTYFEEFGRFIDGGLIANNPTLDVLTEMTENRIGTSHLNGNPGLEHFMPKVVVSLGTGRPPVIKDGDSNEYAPKSLWISRAWATLKDAKAGFKLLVNMIIMTDNRVVDRARSWCAMFNIPYFRLSPQLCNIVELDETDDEILINILWETMIYINERRDQIQKLANILTHGKN